MIVVFTVLGTLAALVALRHFSDISWETPPDYQMGVSLGKKHMRDTYGIDENNEYHN